MRRVKITILFLVIISMTILNAKNIHRSIANPAPIQLYYYAGGLLPNVNLSLSLLDANVIINANTKNLAHVGEMSFIGNYTIFNPNNEINFTLGAPFALKTPNNCYVIINDSSVPFILINDEDINSTIWNQYLDNKSENPDLYFSRFWIICNITLPKETSLKIQYKFNTSSTIESVDWGYYYIIYDVGTSRLWNGNITETVEINIHGKLPDSIYNEQLCMITDISDGKSYKWVWNNEVIDINYVGGEYKLGSYPSYQPIWEEYFMNYVLPILILISPIILCITLKLKKLIDQRKYKL